MEPSVATIAELYKEVHGAIRNVVADLDAEALAWTPGAETSSIAILVVHTLGSEAAGLRLVRGLPSVRDRDAEFVVRPTTAADLLARLDEADALLDEHAAAITADDLASMRERPDRGSRLGRYWLFSNYGHAREHLAHMHLTKQLYQQRNRGS